MTAMYSVGGGASKGGPVTRTSGGGGVDLGCAGAENIFCEPAGEATAENWVHVGNGRGAYAQVENMQYVGGGGSYNREQVVTYSGWRCRTWCILLLLLVTLVGIGLLIWLLLPENQTESQDDNSKTQVSDPFDCEAGYWNWEKGWSVAKKHWCCDRMARGCHRTTSLPFDCDAGYSNWQVGWSVAKKHWCCIHANRGCFVPPPVVTKPYDCAAGLTNWADGWSPGKKLWCCAKENLGCTTSLPYDCDAGFSNWQAGWSEAKKRWCCDHTGKACFTTTSLPYDCNAGFSNWQSGWSVGKKRWCCAHRSRGCEMTGSCTLWGDPHIFTFDRSRLVFYSEGDFWIVKSTTISIQGRFQATDWTRKNDNTDYSSMTGIIVSGQFVQHHKIEVGPMDSGKITCDGIQILENFGTANCGGGTVYYNTQGALVDNAMAFLPHRVVHMTLPNNVVIQTNRWPNFINAKITMQQEPGQTGVCGDFNQVVHEGIEAGKALHAKFGYGVPADELLFPESIPLHIPAKMPSSKRCGSDKRARAEAICHHAAADAVGWSFAECLGDVCDPHSSTAEEMKNQMIHG